MEEVFIRYINMPVASKAFTATDENGDYNIYVNTAYNCEQQQAAIRHELTHINMNHFSDSASVKKSEKQTEILCGDGPVSLSINSNVNRHAEQSCTNTDYPQDIVRQLKEEYKVFKEKHPEYLHNRHHSSSIPLKTRMLPLNHPDKIALTFYERGRKAAGLSVEKVAAMLQIPPGLYYSYEKEAVSCPRETDYILRRLFSVYRKK